MSEEQLCQEAKCQDSDEFVGERNIDRSPACRSLIRRLTAHQLADRLLNYPRRRLSLV